MNAIKSAATKMKNVWRYVGIAEQLKQGGDDGISIQLPTHLSLYMYYVVRWGCSYDDSFMPTSLHFNHISMTLLQR